MLKAVSVGLISNNVETVARADGSNLDCSTHGMDLVKQSAILQTGGFQARHNPAVSMMRDAPFSSSCSAEQTQLNRRGICTLKSPVFFVQQLSSLTCKWPSVRV
jgi:hypothetical protein